MNYSVTQLQEKLTSEYRMDAKVYELGQDVIFFGSELECYKMADKFKTKESRVAYSENLGAFYVSFPKWFNAKFAQKIASK